MKLLKEDVLAKVLLKNYEESAPEFLAFVDGYASGRNDAALSGMILQLYEFSRSYPWPKKWLLAAAESYGIEDEASLESAAFMQSLLQNLKRVSEDLVALSGRAYKLTQDDDGPDMYAKALEGDLKNIRRSLRVKVLRIFIRITAIYPMTGLLPPVDLTETKKN